MKTMMSFREGRLVNLSLPPSTVWLLSKIAEAKGRQDLFRKQPSHILQTLREMALIQSVESSNRIEGVSVAQDRLAPLVIGNSRPRDRSEEEIQGYRRALRLIHTRSEKLSIDPAVLLRLHKTCQQGSGDAGEWKRIDNEIVELRPDRAPILRFRAVTAKSTPNAVRELCRSYRHLLGEERIHPLVLTAGFVLDFLCIHPFRDGNGRVSRLATLIALYQAGYEVGRYVSLERLMEESKEDYYEVLQESSRNWHNGRHDLLPWLNYFLTTIRRAYQELEERADRAKTPWGGKTSLVVSAVRDLEDDFTIQELVRKCPTVSYEMVRRVLRDLKKAGKVECLGRGPGALWRKRDS